MDLTQYIWTDLIAEVLFYSQLSTCEPIMPSMPNAQIAQINGNSLAFYEWGEKGNPVLVCLHSHTNSAASWREFAEFASSKYHVFALDQRGHGNSEWANDGYARDRFVEDLSEFVKLNGFETVVSEGVQVAILHLENANIELMEPTSDSSPIKKFLEKRGSGLHHIALETPNIEGEVSRMESCGIQF